MVLVKNQQSLERTNHHRVDLVILGAIAEGQAHEVLNIGERVVGVQERLTDALLVRVGRHDGQLRQQAERRNLDVLGLLGVERVFVVGREGRHSRRQDRHRVRIAREPGEEVLQVFVQQSVTLDVVFETRQLARRRQFAVDEQPGGLEKAEVGRNLLDWVAAITQDSRIAIDVGNRRLGRGCVDEPIVESVKSGGCRELGHIDGVAPVGATQDGEFVRYSVNGDRNGAAICRRNNGVCHV